MGHPLLKAEVTRYASPELRRSLTRFERMVNTNIWTNRLERVLQGRLNELKVLFNKLHINLQAVERELPKDSHQRLTLRELRDYSQRVYEDIYPELIELFVFGADFGFMRDSRIVELTKRVKFLEYERTDVIRFKRSLIYRFWRRLSSPRRFANNNKDTVATVPEWSDLPDSLQQVERQLEGTESLQELGNNYASVTNNGSAFDIFRNWKSVFHHQGQRFGSTAPITHDHLDHLVEINQIVGFHGKTILELGPFEAANTKELADLGAKRVVAIEANAEFFLKCLIVKNECKLDTVDFIFGDCNEVLARKEFKNVNWFDICLASGILYHMEDPLYTIDLLVSTAPVIFIWTQVADEKQPLTEWSEIKDAEGRTYRGKKNIYKHDKHWGGVGRGGFWMREEDMLRAFEDRGYDALNIKQQRNKIGMSISFIACRRNVSGIPANSRSND